MKRKRGRGIKSEECLPSALREGAIIVNIAVPICMIYDEYEDIIPAEPGSFAPDFFASTASTASFLI